MPGLSPCLERSAAATAPPRQPRAGLTESGRTAAPSRVARPRRSNLNRIRAAAGGARSAPSAEASRSPLVFRPLMIVGPLPGSRVCTARDTQTAHIQTVSVCRCLCMPVCACAHVPLSVCVCALQGISRDIYALQGIYATAHRAAHQTDRQLACLSGLLHTTS